MAKRPDPMDMPYDSGFDSESAQGVEDAKNHEGPLLRSIVLSAGIYLSAVLSLAAVVFLSLLTRGPEVFHLSKETLGNICGILNIFAIGLALLAINNRLRVLLPLAVLANIIIFSASAGLLIFEFQSNDRWEMVDGKVIAYTRIAGFTYSKYGVSSRPRGMDTNSGMGGTPAYTVHYMLNGNEIEAKVLGKPIYPVATLYGNELPVVGVYNVGDKIEFYYNPENPSEVLLNPPNSFEQYDFLLKTSCVAFLTALASAFALLAYQSKLTKQLHSERAKAIAEHKHGAPHISAEKADGTHIQLYDPIPGAEHHEVILKPPPHHTDSDSQD